MDKKRKLKADQIDRFIAMRLGDKEITDQARKMLGSFLAELIRDNVVNMDLIRRELLVNDFFATLPRNEYQKGVTYEEVAEDYGYSSRQVERAVFAYKQARMMS